MSIVDAARAVVLRRMIVRRIAIGLLCLFAVGCSSSEPSGAPLPADAGADAAPALPEPVAPPTRDTGAQ